MGSLRVGILGASGRMGKMLSEATLKDGEATLGAAFDLPGSTSYVGRKSSLEVHAGDGALVALLALGGQDVGGRTQTAYGTACQPRDGTWQIQQ